MIYDILLKTTCTYDRPTVGRQALRVMPADESSAQRLIAGSLEVLPGPAERRDRFDFFGNQTTDVSFEKPGEAIELVVRARVDRFADPPVFDVSGSLAGLANEIAANRSLLANSPHHFVDASPLVGPSKAIADYARSLRENDVTVMQLVKTVNDAIHRDMTYESGSTEVDTPLEEAFANRQGVCQDFSHIMIACLRELGVPAGYVSGYLRTKPPEGKPRLEGADAMHAWVQAWCGAAAGWVELDPTNAMLAGQDHIVVARGRDYSDVSPVRGVLRTAGRQKIAQAVDVIPVVR